MPNFVNLAKIMDPLWPIKNLAKYKTSFKIYKRMVFYVRFFTVMQIVRKVPLVSTKTMFAWFNFTY